MIWSEAWGIRVKICGLDKGYVSRRRGELPRALTNFRRPCRSQRIDLGSDDVMVC